MIQNCGKETGQILKQPSLITQRLEHQSRGSGLELRGGNPEVESLTMLCTNPPYATHPPELKGRCGILPGIH